MGGLKLKLNRMFIVSILLVIVLAIGAASASEVISDDVAAIEPTDEVIAESVVDEPTEEAVSASVEEEVTDSNVLGDGENDISSKFEVDLSDDIFNGMGDIDIVSSYDKAGEIIIFLDNEQIYSGSISKYSPHYVQSYELGVYDKDQTFKRGSGYYTIKVNFLNQTEQINVTIAEKSLFFMNYEMDYSNMFMGYGETLPYSIRFPDVTSGHITIYEYGIEGVGKELGSANIIDKTATVEISGLTKNQNVLFIKYSTDLHDGNMTAYIFVCNNTENVAVSVPTVIEQGDKAIVTVKSNESAKAFIIVDGVVTTYSDVSSVNHILPALSVGTHTVRVVFARNPGEFSPFYSNTFKITVKPKSVPAKIVAKDYSAYYNKGTYAVTVYGTDGKVAKGASVVFKINGKKVATVKTDGKGVAKVKIPTSYAPKTYKITATALGKTATKKLTVKQVLTLKKVTVKKSAKSLSITATLKEGKKAIKGKKITFKFNGKKYTAKTNKKGIAKITMMKAVLKKLKAGKNLTYQATYIKDTVKKTVKVKK